jgi:uncharacterized protein (TIGR03067 family)
MKTLWVPALAGVLVGATLSRPEEGAKGVAAKLVGTWEVVTGEKGGQKEPAERIKGTEVQFTRETIVVTTKNAARAFRASYKLGLERKPYAITMKALDGPDKGKAALGVFELDGNNLKLCYALPGEKAPEDFTTRPGSSRLLFTMRRAK